jgi:hypothetical protein
MALRYTMVYLHHAINGISMTMKRFLYIPLFCLLLSACKNKKVDLMGDEPIKIEDLQAAFPKLTSNFQMADTNFFKKADTTRISYKVLNQFFPDSIMLAVAGKDKKAEIKPLGLIEKEKENYWLINVTQKKRNTSSVVLVTDKDMKFLAYKTLLTNNRNDGYAYAVSINKEPTFMISREKMQANNNLRFTRSGWVYNEGAFMIVVNDSNEDPEKTAIINPIDTLPRLNKLSGDYIKNEKNFISLRDGKNTGEYLFFIHFEKDNGTCVGELKGEIKMKSATTGIYTANGDPCIVDFTFSGNTITVKEKGSCGNRRGIKCFFDDSFRKKKEPKPKKKKA